MIRTEDTGKVVPEEGTIVFKLSFRDYDKSLVPPITLFWDLSALDGTIVAYNQEVTELACTVYIVLSGSLTRILYGEERYGDRLLTVRATYNSDLGSNLPLNKQYAFRIKNLRLIGYPLSVEVVEMIFTDDYVRDVGVA